MFAHTLRLYNKLARASPQAECGWWWQKEILLLVKYFAVSKHFILVTKILYGNKVRKHIQNVEKYKDIQNALNLKVS